MTGNIDETLKPLFELTKTLKEKVDILIQHSENYYVMCDLLHSNKKLATSRTFKLTRMAVGFEMVNRIYRLTDKAKDSINFGILGDKYLREEIINHALFMRFNSDKTKDKKEFDAILQEIRSSIEKIYRCPELEKVKIFRHRYTAHMIPRPRDLDKFGPDADVDQMNSSDLRLLTDRLVFVLDRVEYLSKRSMFGSEDRGRMAKREALELWQTVANSP